MLQEVMWAYCDQFHVVFVLPALWYYDQQKSEVGRDRDWEEWDSGCHRTSDSDSSLNFDIHNIFLDMVNIFRITIVTCRPIWKWSVSSILWAHFFQNLARPASIWRSWEVRVFFVFLRSLIGGHPIHLCRCTAGCRDSLLYKLSLFIMFLEFPMIYIFL